MTTPFNQWFPTSQHGDPAINVMAFGAFGDTLGHPLSGMGYADLDAAQEDYPSATDLSDYADWCAITEAIKAAFTEDGVRHEGQGYKNRPLCFPAGIYVINKPIDIVGVSDAWIYGTGNYTQIYNETETAPNNICIRVNGLRYSRIENLAFGAKGTDAIAFALNSTSGATVDGQPVTVMSHGNVWIGCSFTALGENTVGCLMGGGDGYMGSEQTFIRCASDNNTFGWIVGNANALSYLFITCLGNRNESSAIRVNTGGGITCINCAFSYNLECDIDNYASSPITLINCRTESRFHVRNPVGFTLFMGCNQSASSSEVILCESNIGARIITTDTFQSRLTGEGEFTIDNPLGNFAAAWFTGISNSGGLVKITHPNHEMYSIISEWTGAPYGWEWWRDGDQVQIEKVVGTTHPTAPSVNGVWTIHKLNSTSFELVGSTYVADTYLDLTDGAPAGNKGYMKPGPRYHLATIPWGRPSSVPGRRPGLAVTENMSLLWFDSGTTFTNLGATGDITFTLSDPANTHYHEMQGTYYSFVVVEAHAITIVTPSTGYAPESVPGARIYRAGGYATAGTQVTSAVVGNRIEIQLIGGKGGSGLGALGHRWLITSETGTWTIAGTPA